MANSLPIDISILEDQVIEVTEMEDAMEECMMFVKKLSETSLTEMEKEKLKLQELLEKAEKEMKNMKQALKRSCSKRDEWRDKCLLERDAKAHVDKQVKEAKHRMQKMETTIEENKNSLKVFQQQKQRSAESLKELKDRVSAQKSAKKSLEDELSDVKKSLADVKKDNEEIRKRLFEECQKSQSRINEDEDRLIDLQAKLTEGKSQFESLEKDYCKRIRLLEEKLVEKQAMNKRLSEEAELHISEVEQKLEKSEGSVAQSQRHNEELRAKLELAEKDVESFEGRLTELRVENEITVGQKDHRIRELIEKLTERNQSVSDNNGAGSRKRAVTDDDVNEKTGKEEIAGKKAERYEDKTTSTNSESKSWANMVEEESLNELEQKYNHLMDDHTVIQRQFAHLKKHRNQILRENNELHYHVQMATLQLASGNTRFRQQMDQFRVRLQVAESMYEDKVLECNMLDNQLKQLYSGEIYAEVYPAPGYV